MVMETEANSSDAEDIFELEMSSPQDPHPNQTHFSQPPPDVYGSLSNLHISNHQYDHHNPEPFSPINTTNFSPRGGTYPLPNKRTHEGSRGLNSLLPSKKGMFDSINYKAMRLYSIFSSAYSHHHHN
jgi:hypothetical protein